MAINQFDISGKTVVVTGASSGISHPPTEPISAS